MMISHVAQKHSAWARDLAIGPGVDARARQTA